MTTGQTVVGLGELRRRAAAALALCFAAAPVGTAAVAVLALVDGACAPAVVWATKRLLDAVFAGGSGTAVAVATLVLVLVTLIGAAQRSVHGYLGPWLGRAIRLVVMDRLFRRIGQIDDLARFEDPAFRDRMRLAEQVSDQAPAQLIGTGSHLVRSVTQLAGFAAVLVAVWPPAALLMVAVAVPAGIVHARLGRARAETVAGLSGNVRRQFFYKALLTDPRAVKEVLLFGIGGFLHGRLLRDFGHANAAENAVGLRTLRVSVALDLAGGLVTAAGVAMIAWHAARGQVSVGEAVAFLAAVTGVHVAATSAATAGADGYTALLLFGAYQQMVQQGPGSSPRPGRAPGPLTDGIEFRDVWFRYHDDGAWVLRGVSFRLRRGETVGLVGLNGAGKSTVVKLLCRLYEPQRGSIRWDGDDLGSLDPAQLRQRLSAVFQDYMEYDLTAAENIGIGDLRAEFAPAHIHRAAAAAGIDRDLAALPDAYDTLLSRMFLPDTVDGAPGGGAVAMLSGGQWQRVAAARGFIRDHADVIILDEPSAGLDAEAEYALHQRLRQLRAGRTSLIISHRLSSLRDADRILVLDSGRITESGTHAQLLAGGGGYARLFRLQAAGYQLTDEPAAPLAAT